MVTMVRTVAQRRDAELPVRALRYASMHPDPRQVLQQFGSRSRNRPAFDVHHPTQEPKHRPHSNGAFDPTEVTCSTSKPAPNVATDFMAMQAGNEIIIPERDAGQRTRGWENSSLCIGRPDGFRSTTSS